MSIQLERPAGTATARISTDRAVADPPRTIEVVIRPPSGWRLVDLGELWRFRVLLHFLTWRDVKVRYKRTMLGTAWAVLQPLLMMVVFTVFFGRLARMPTGGPPYPLFARAGLLPWTFFATAIANAGNSVGSEPLITKIYIPRLAIPFAAVGAAVVDFAVALGLPAGLMAYYGVSPGPGLLASPVVFGLILLAALANIRRALGRQQGSGWLEGCRLEEPSPPLTHTPGHALRGAPSAARTPTRASSTSILHL